MVLDIISGKIYVHLRKVENNNVKNNNDVGRGKIQLFPSTVGVCMYIFCGATYYHMMCNIKVVNMQLPNES